MAIINSLLDTDFYKFTMGQFVFNQYANVEVEYSFTDRSLIRGFTGPNEWVSCLPQFIDMEELKKELDSARALRFTDDEIDYLAFLEQDGKKIFSRSYILFLKDLKLPGYSLKLGARKFDLRFYGKWPCAIFWETIALSIINELFFQKLLELRFDETEVFIEGSDNLKHKIALLQQNPQIVFADFGTRRRFSFAWHKSVIKKLSRSLSPEQFIGTSNMYLAKKYGLPPVGTMAHEIFQGISALNSETDQGLKASHNKALDQWWQEYCYSMSIALTDTFGSDFFFADMTDKQAHQWKGLRQDSGDPIEFGERAIKFYQDKGINPLDKLIVFSDGLEIETMLELAKHFNGRIKYAFGWGTNLTNDLGFSPLSLVVKLTKADGSSTVKLSDNLAKAIGSSKDIERYKKVFGYTRSQYKKCKY